MAVNEKERDDITYEIIEHIGVIAVYPTKWQKEVNIVSWNGGPKKTDIRDWDPDHTHMSRGITLHADETKKLLNFLKSMELNKSAPNRDAR